MYFSLLQYVLAVLFYRIYTISICLDLLKWHQITRITPLVSWSQVPGRTWIGSIMQPLPSSIVLDQLHLISAISVSCFPQVPAPIWENNLVSSTITCFYGIFIWCAQNTVKNDVIFIWCAQNSVILLLGILLIFIGHQIKSLFT